MISSNIMLGPRLKVERAYAHVDELRSLINPLSPALYTVEIEPQIVPPNTRSHASILAYRPRKPIPETLALLIGDAVHNFRAALDYLFAPIFSLIEQALPG
nr:hypothetical protein [Pseudomonadota bacterium]